MSAVMVSKYEVRRLGLVDLEQFKATPEATLWSYMTPACVNSMIMSDSWSGLYDGQLLVSGGLVRIWPGLAEAWVAVTPLAKDHKVFVYRNVKAYLDNAIVFYGLRRVQATVRAGFLTAEKFAYKLGFCLDASLAKYGPNGETFHLISRVM